MKNLVHVLPELQKAGWNVEGWCWRCGVPEDILPREILSIPPFLEKGVLLIFPAMVAFHALYVRYCRKSNTPGIIHSTGASHLVANVVSIHFLTPHWVAMHRKVGIHSLKEALQFCFALAGAALELIMYKLPVQRTYLAVSNSVATEVRKLCHESCRVTVVPSAYDAARYSPEIRRNLREQSRAEFGFRDTDIVLSFASQGGYRRKGLFLGLEAIHLTRKSNPSLRLLVIGGAPRVVEQLSKHLDANYADWEKWVTLAGHVPDMPAALSASDAFFFPSYFESFASVELEAAALGLPLLLTQHYGIEMTLEAGVNGELLSFDPIEMSEQLLRFASNAHKYRYLKPRGVTMDEFFGLINGVYTQVATTRDL